MTNSHDSSPKFEIKHPPQIRRIFAGAVIVVLGVVLFRGFSEAIGLFLILVGVAIGIRQSIGSIFVAIICIAVFALILSLMYSTVSDEYRFGEWLRYRWWLILYPAFIVLMPLFSSLRQTADAWAVLTADYGGGADVMSAQQKYDAVSGYLRLDPEIIFVYATASESGIFVVREDKGHIYFPWTKIKSIRVSGDTTRSADLEIPRRSMLPLRLNIPWLDDFTTLVPTSVQVMGN
ncbi:MAG: hypothetical protein WBM76_11230 [Woeseiaceae bacterium]